MKDRYFDRANMGFNFVLDCIERAIIALLRFAAGVLLFPFWLFGWVAPDVEDTEMDDWSGISKA